MNLVNTDQTESNDRKTDEQLAYQEKQENAIRELENLDKEIEQKSLWIFTTKQIASLYTKRYFLLEKIYEINHRRFESEVNKNNAYKAKWGEYELFILNKEIFALQNSDHPNKAELFKSVKIKELNVRHSLGVIYSELFLEAVPCVNRDLPPLTDLNVINDLISEAKLEEHKIKKYRFHPNGMEAYRLVIKRLHILQRAKDDISHTQSVDDYAVQKSLSPRILRIYTISYGFFKGLAALLLVLVFGVAAFSFGRSIDREFLEIGIVFGLACSFFSVFSGLRSFLVNGTTGVEILVFDNTPIIFPPSNPGRGLDNLKLIRWIVGIATAIGFNLLYLFLLVAARDIISQAMMLLLFVGGLVCCALGVYIAKKTVPYID